MIEIKPSELHNHIGSKIIIKYNGTEEEVTLVNVKGNSFSVRIKRDGLLDGIEPWYKMPEEDNPLLNIYIYE